MTPVVLDVASRGSHGQAFNRLNDDAPRASAVRGGPFNRLNACGRTRYCSGGDVMRPLFNRLNAHSSVQKVRSDDGDGEMSFLFPFNRLDGESIHSLHARTARPFNRLNGEESSCGNQVGVSVDAGCLRSFNRLNDSARQPTRRPRKRFNRLNDRHMIPQKKTPRLPGAFSFGPIDLIGDKP